MKPSFVLLPLAAFCLALAPSASAKPDPVRAGNAPVPAGAAEFVPAAGDDDSPAARGQKLFRARMERDAKAFPHDRMAAIETLFADGVRGLKTPEGLAALNKLAVEHPKSNRAGCALQYLGQFARNDADRERFLRRAISEHSDAVFGDGVQVGAYARLHLAHLFLKTGRAAEARVLAAEIQKNFPDAVDHRGRRLLNSKWFKHAAAGGPIEK
ncbi:MAG: hypothetical protein LBR07_10015 [Puniceicoccales bacterium]|jgi:hypothetical protein|nr:hypothetical protein [Puniceicoccales bacterium]